MAKTQLNSKSIKNSSILNEDIADNAAISQSKISGLVSDIAALQSQTLPPITNQNGKVLGVLNNTVSWLNSTLAITNITLGVAGWTLVNSVYEYTYTNSEILASSTVNIFPHTSSLETVYAAQISSNAESFDGYLKIYSNKQPTSNITVDFLIFKNITTIVSQSINTLSGFPAQTGNSGKVLTTDGTNLSWGNIHDTASVNTTYTDLNINVAMSDVFIINLNINSTFGLINFSNNSVREFIIKNTSASQITVTLPLGIRPSSNFTLNSNFIRRVVISKYNSVLYIDYSNELN